MKSKRLLALLIVVAALIVIIVVLASVFAVRQVVPVYHNFNGGQIVSQEGAPTANDVLKLSKGKSILFLSKDKVIDSLNQDFPEWHTIGIVKNFPNILEVHFVKRVAVARFELTGGEKVYVDCLGYVVAAPNADSEPINITSAFDNREAKVNHTGEKFEFHSEASNKRMSWVLESIMALWQCNCEIANIPTVLGDSNVFTFTSDGSLNIKTRTEAKIVVITPWEKLTERLINAFSVYCDDSRDLSLRGTTITVRQDGTITTPDGQKISR